MPSELVEEVRPGISSNRPYRSPRPAAMADSTAPYRLGQAVMHPKFGEGTVLAFEGAGEHARVHVNFSAAGPKWLVVAYARLDAL
jgi:DNA helicase II / ATP-dependent DNA helicase PcrA